MSAQNRKKRTPLSRTKRSVLASFKKAFNLALDFKDAPKLHYGRQKWVHERYSVSISAARKWVSGKSLPDIDNLILISDDLGVSIDELVGRKTVESSSSRKKTSLVQKKTISIPLRAFEKAGTNAKSDVAMGEIEFDKEIMASALRMRQNGIELSLIGSDSMAPDINNGDIAFVDTMTKRLEDNKIYLFEASDRHLIRRVILNLDGTVQLICANSKYANHTVDMNQILIGDGDNKDYVLKLIGEVPWTIKRTTG